MARGVQLYKVRRYMGDGTYEYLVAPALESGNSCGWADNKMDGYAFETKERAAWWRARARELALDDEDVVYHSVVEA